MNRFSIITTFALTLGIASLTGCVAPSESTDEVDVTSGEYARISTDIANDDGNGSALPIVEHSEQAITITSLPGEQREGPHPEPWMDVEGPHPEPWQAFPAYNPSSSGGSGSGSGNNGNGDHH